MFKEPRIVFHHIPKCGGMSIVAGLAVTYYPMRLLRYGRKGFPGVLNAKAASAAADMFQHDTYEMRRHILGYHLARGDTPLIPGHYPFSRLLYDRFHPEWRFVSLFRDPVKRWHSEYFWNRYKDHDYAKTDLDIEAYLESRSGLLNARSYTNFLMEAQDPQIKSNADEVKQAIENLDCFKVLGILEDLERFRAAMKSEFGRKPVFIKRNASPAPQEKKIIPDADSAFHKKLLDLLAGDIEIYNAVKEKVKK